MPPGLRIVIAEDAAIMRDGLTQTLTRRGHDVVAAVDDAASLHAAVRTHLPDVAPSDNDNRRVIAALRYLES